MTPAPRSGDDESAPRRRSIVGLGERELRSEAGRLLASIRWDGRALEPSETSAAAFLSALVRG